MGRAVAPLVGEKGTAKRGPTNESSIDGKDTNEDVQPMGNCDHDGGFADVAGRPDQIQVRRVPNVGCTIAGSPG